MPAYILGHEITEVYEDKKGRLASIVIDGRVFVPKQHRKSKKKHKKSKTGR